MQRGYVATSAHFPAANRVSRVSTQHTRNLVQGASRSTVLAPVKPSPPVDSTTALTESRVQYAAPGFIHVQKSPVHQHVEPASYDPVPQPPSQPTSEEELDVDEWAHTQGYTLPQGEAVESQPHIKSLYKPRTSDVPGVAMACTVIGTWALVFWHAMFKVHLPWDLVGFHTDGSHTQAASSWLHIAGTFFALEFLYTGLFITTHDAMHGTIAMRNRPLNDFIGRLAISLYAWFDYDMLHQKHWEHHNHTGVVGVDPDYHDGKPGIVPWFLRFMTQYMSSWQFTRISWWALVMTLAGAPLENMLLYMTGAPIVSALRLFYFGTYTPHHPDPGPEAATKEMSWPLSRTQQSATILSFFTCYHFGLHWEHHRWPYAPWWDLPKCRELSGRGPGSNKQSDRQSTQTESFN